jgi:hypothetical protein
MYGGLSDRRAGPRIATNANASMTTSHAHIGHVARTSRITAAPSQADTATDRARSTIPQARHE